MLSDPIVKEPTNNKNGLHSFQQLSAMFEEQFKRCHFPASPEKLYQASQHLLDAGGKRIRPVLCLMGNELFDTISTDTFHVANAIELFHNFTLVHDDIMDRAPLRRGKPTVHEIFGEPTALLAGDVMLVTAYEYLNNVTKEVLKPVLALFNVTARQVCEGQQLDMDFEQMPQVEFDEYVKMIGLKTSVLLAASLRLGAILGGAGLGNQHHIYEFGKNLGIAFQIQDDYLDAFGDPEKFGKKTGGDIVANKKTFLLLHTLKVVSETEREKLLHLLETRGDNKVQDVLSIYRNCNIDEWAKDLKQNYFNKALFHLEEIAVISQRKKPLKELAEYLLERDM